MDKLIFVLIFSILLTGCDRHQSPVSSIEVAVKGAHSASLDDKSAHAIIGSIHHGGSLWSIKNIERHFNWNHKDQEASTIQASDFSHSAKWAATADPHTLVLWNTESGAGERYWVAPGKILDIELGPGASFALLGLDDHSAVIFDIRRGGIKRRFQHGNRVRSVDLSQDGNTAITGSEDYSARIWDVTSGKQLFKISHKDDVQLVKISPDGSIALSVSKYDRAILWNAKTGEPLGDIPLGTQQLKRGLHFTAARFSKDNELLLTGRPDQIVDLWQTSTFEKLGSWKLPKRNAWKPTSASVLDVGFSEESGVYYAIGSNGFIHRLELILESY